MTARSFCGMEAFRHCARQRSSYLSVGLRPLSLPAAHSPLSLLTTGHLWLQPKPPPQSRATDTPNSSEMVLNIRMSLLLCLCIYNACLSHITPNQQVPLCPK